MFRQQPKADFVDSPQRNMAWFHHVTDQTPLYSLMDTCLSGRPPQEQFLVHCGYHQASNK